MAEADHRSVSQLNQYNRCPYSYYLARIEKVWKRPAAWLAQGSAVHEAAEAYERSKLTAEPLTLDETLDVFSESYRNHINEACEETPNFNAWFASGPYRGEEDISRRFGIGMDQTQRFVEWTDSHPEEVIWIAPDGTPGIELAFDVELGGVPVRGFIDAIVETDGVASVRDYKTGNKPGDDFQLGVYAVAVATTYDEYGVPPIETGDYWMGRTGKPTAPYDLSDWSYDRVTEAFVGLNDALAAGDFPAIPEASKCRFCDVSASCKYK